MNGVVCGEQSRDMRYPSREKEEAAMGYRGWFTHTKMWKGAAIGVMAVGLSGCSAMYGGGLYGGGGYYGDDYYDDGYGYDGYGYDDYGYDPYYNDYRAGYPNIGYGGGWYNNYYYPGYGTYIYDRYGQYWMMNQYYRNYWGNWRDDWGRRHHRDWDRNHGRRGDGFNPGRIAREALETPRQGDSPRLRARPENINRSTAQVVRDGRTDRARDGRDGRGRGGFGDRTYQRTVPQDVNGVAQPRTVERQNIERRNIERRQVEGRRVAPVIRNDGDESARPQMRQRGSEGGGFGRRVMERSRPQVEGQQQPTPRQRAVAPAPQQRQQAAPPQRTMESRPTVRQAPPPRSNPRHEGGQIREQ